MMTSKLPILVLASAVALFALSAPAAFAKDKRAQKWFGYDERSLGPGQGIGGAGATPGPGGGNTPVTTGTQAFGANGNPNLPVNNLSGTGPSTAGGGGAGGGGAAGGGGGNGR
jgi:hypothetical protein